MDGRRQSAAAERRLWKCAERTGWVKDRVPVFVETKTNGHKERKKKQMDKDLTPAARLHRDEHLFLPKTLFTDHLFLAMAIAEAAAAAGG